MFHRVNALYGLLDLAHFGELLAHLKINLKSLGKLLGSIVGFRKADEQDRIENLSEVLQEKDES